MFALADAEKVVCSSYLKVLLIYAPYKFNFPATSAGPTSPLSFSSGSPPFPVCSCSATSSIGWSSYCKVVQQFFRY